MNIKINKSVWREDYSGLVGYESKYFGKKDTSSNKNSRNNMNNWFIPNVVSKREIYTTQMKKKDWLEIHEKKDNNNKNQTLRMNMIEYIPKEEIIFKNFLSQQQSIKINLNFSNLTICV